MIVIVKTIQWIKRNWVSLILGFLLIGMILFHFFKTYNPPIVQPTMTINPKTKDKVLVNGQIAQIKASMSNTENPQFAGFSKAFVQDTINKILNVKDKEILSVRQTTGTYKDTLQFVREELDESKKLVKYYQSKDSKGNVVGNGKITDGISMVFEGNTNLINVLKKGEFDKKGKRLTPDSLIFYDPNQKFKVNGSWEYTYTIPEEKRKTSKFKVGLQAGVGPVIPIKVQEGKVKIKDIGVGFYTGVGVTYTF